MARDEQSADSVAVQITDGGRREAVKMMALPPLTARVIWHHVGREHERPYAASIRKNPPDVIDEYLTAKVNDVLARGPNAFQHEGLLVEIHDRSDSRRSLIIYDEAHGLQVSRGNKGDDWLIDIVAIQHHSSGVAVSRDLFIDVRVADGSSCAEVLDLDEFAEGLAIGALGAGEAAGALRSLQRALERIKAGSLPGPAASLLWERYCGEPIGDSPHAN